MSLADMAGPNPDIEARARRLSEHFQAHRGDHAGHIPHGALFRFAFLIADPVEPKPRREHEEDLGFAYLDFRMSFTGRRPDPWVGGIDAVTLDGWLARLDFAGDQVGELILRPLRTNVDRIVVTWVDGVPNAGVLGEGNVHLVLRDGSQVVLPRERRKQPDLVRRLTAALDP